MYILCSLKFSPSLSLYLILSLPANNAWDGNLSSMLNF